MDNYISIKELESEFEDWFNHTFKYSNEYEALAKLNGGEFSYELRKIVRNIFIDTYETAYNSGYDWGYECCDNDRDFDDDNY
jgi:hypothetical protein